MTITAYKIWKHGVKISLIVAIGVAIWVPYGILSGFLTGKMFAGPQSLSETLPLVILGVAAIVFSGEGGSGFRIAWICALAPLLMALGSFFASIAVWLFFGNTYSAGKNLWGALISSVVWASIAVFQYGRRPTGDVLRDDRPPALPVLDVEADDFALVQQMNSFHRGADSVPATEPISKSATPLRPR